MATLMHAISVYGPRVERTHTVQTQQIAEYISARTSLNRGEIENVLSELNEAITFFAKQGSSIKLAGVGTFSLAIKLRGTFDMGFRLDASINRELNTPGAVTGSVRNPENIGKSSDELKSMWNADHPDDPIP